MPLSRRSLFAGTTAVLAAAGGLVAIRGAQARYYDGPVSDHFDGLHFFDPQGVPPKSPLDLLRWWSSNGRQAWPKWEAGLSDRPPRRVDDGSWRISYVGHASVLLQVAGLNILLDPVWSERVSPVSFAGPKRVNDPGVAFDALPPIDAVLVSHAHYDHLDTATLAALMTPHKPRIITPLGNDTIMRAFDPSIRAETHDWGDTVELGRGVRVTLAPMRHWSARGLMDRNKALWAAFIIETPAGRIYQVGDTGYGDGWHFRHVRERYGPIRLAILPIGAYEPRWFMSDQHMNPAEAVQAFIDCGAEFAMAHHHGTFQLTDEAIDAPTLALKDARAAAGIAPERFRMLRPGEVWEVAR
jgi:L-ascorbate metabolism protein UlaG (beta-lactamase superfamily)